MILKKWNYCLVCKTNKCKCKTTRNMYITKYHDNVNCENEKTQLFLKKLVN